MHTRRGIGLGDDRDASKGAKTMSDGTRLPSRRTKDDVRARILEAATSLFYERGYLGVSMSDIGRAVDLTPPALYWYFHSKEELFFNVLEAGLRSFVLNVAGVVKAASPADRLQQFVGAHVRWQLERRNLASAYGALYAGGHGLEYMDTSRRRILIKLQRRHLDNLRAILNAGIAKGEFSVPNVTACAFAIISMCEDVVTWFRREGALSTDELATLYGDLARRMVGDGRATTSATRSDAESGGLVAARLP